VQTFDCDNIGIEDFNVHLVSLKVEREMLMEAPEGSGRAGDEGDAMGELGDDSATATRANRAKSAKIL
jgi:hypothetical protein